MAGQPEWLAGASRGIERGYTVEVFIDGKTHAIVKFPGHSFWAGRGCPSGWAPTSYCLLHKKTGRMTEAKDLHEGRMTLAVRERLAETLRLADEGLEP